MPHFIINPFTGQLDADASSSTGIIPPSKGGTGVANPTAHTLPVAEGASPFNFLGPLTNGQLLIGSTGADPSPGAITSTGGTISVTLGAGTINLENSSGGFKWNTVAGTSQSITAENGYINSNVALTTFTLPATASVGDTFQIAGYGSGGWAIAQNAGQKIYLGNATTSVGVAGSLASTNAHDSIEIMCVIANTEWQALDFIGNITVV